MVHEQSKRSLGSHNCTLQGSNNPHTISGMGAKLHYMVNLQNTFPKSIKTSNSWDIFNNRSVTESPKSTGFFNLQDSMDRLLEESNRESVKKTMILHEEIFKEQVRELHKLYRVQKILMADLRNKEAKIRQLARPTTRSETKYFFSGNQNLSMTETNSGYNFNQLYSIRNDPSSQEQSSSCSGETFKMPRGLNLERPAGEDISTDQARSSSRRVLKDKMTIDDPLESKFCTDRENELELTLSIGTGSIQKKLKNHKPNSSLKFGFSESTHIEKRQRDPSISIGLDGGNMGSSGELLDRESLQRPAWLFPALSLNRT